MTAEKYVDRSGTNWTPWPRLAGVPHRLQVVGGIGCIMGAAGLLFAWRMKVGGPKPGTMTKEWEEATEKAGLAKEREAGDPVMLNPITNALKNKSNK